MTTVLAFIALAAWIWLLVARGQFWRVDRPDPAPAPAHWPDVVVAIPARDEADQIARCVASLLRQDYSGQVFVVVADDASTDGTAAVAEAAAAAVSASDRLQVVTVPPLPEGWTGKMWAQSRAIEAGLAAHPRAELVLLTDADILHAPGELSHMVSRLDAEGLDMASLMVRLSTATTVEKWIVPAFVFFFRLLYPFRWVAAPTRHTAAAAGGYILIRASTLSLIGGLAAVRDELIDDCSLAGRVKNAGGRISLDLAEETRSLRRYAQARDLWMMIARTAYTQLGYSPWLLLGTVVALLVGLVLPPVLVLGCFHGAFLGLLAWVAMSVAFAPLLRHYGLCPLRAPLLPVIALFYLGATVDSAWRHIQGRGGEWKGRTASPKGGAGA